MTEKKRIYHALVAFNNRGPDSAAWAERTEVYYRVRDSLNRKLKLLDLHYVMMHPNSYLSAYLLSRLERRLSVDSLQNYFVQLAKGVKRSGIGHDVLLYLYPLTDDNEFRKRNPLVDRAFSERLRKVSSIYEASLKDSTGKLIDWNVFKGKYLVVDSWASWCKPCIANIPALKKLSQSYDPDSIRFVSVSLDKEIDPWKHAMEKFDFHQEQYHEQKSFQSLIAVYCRVLWVPKYVLVDKTGRIINYDLPQAVDQELKKMLDEVLRHN
ncbi:MAG TPA: TlpA disulfide reductase family protein [Puia sp.]|nr:TlpA disulfide reductase family protein [Puia sp.]